MVTTGLGVNGQLFPDTSVGGGTNVPINPTGNSNNYGASPTDISPVSTATPVTPVGTSTGLGVGGSSIPVGIPAPTPLTPKQVGLSPQPNMQPFTSNAQGYGLSLEQAQTQLANTPGLNPDQISYIQSMIQNDPTNAQLITQVTQSNPQIAAALAQQGIPITQQNVDQYIWQNPQYQTADWRALQQKNYGSTGFTAYSGAEARQANGNVINTGPRISEEQSGVDNSGNIPTGLGVDTTSVNNTPTLPQQTDTSGGLGVLNTTPAVSTTPAATIPATNAVTGLASGGQQMVNGVPVSAPVSPTGAINPTTGTGTGTGNFNTGLPVSPLSSLNVGSLLGTTDPTALTKQLDDVYGSGVGDALVQFLQNGAGYNPSVVTALNNAFQPYKEEASASINEAFGASGAAGGSSNALALERLNRDLALGEDNIVAGQYSNAVDRYSSTLGSVLEGARLDKANQLNPLDYINAILGGTGGISGLLGGLISKIPGLGGNTANTQTGGANTQTGNTQTVIINNDGTTSTVKTPTPTGTTLPPNPKPPTLPPAQQPFPISPPTPTQPTQPTGTSTSNIVFNPLAAQLGITDPTVGQWFSGLDPGLQQYLASNPNIFNDINPGREIPTQDSTLNDQWLTDTGGIPPDNGMTEGFQNWLNSVTAPIDPNNIVPDPNFDPGGTDPFGDSFDLQNYLDGLTDSGLGAPDPNGGYDDWSGGYDPFSGLFDVTDYFGPG